MVILDFRIDENVLAEDRNCSPVTANPGVIETTYFMMPVRFCIDGKELLETPSNVWMPQPLLGFATHLVQALRAMSSTGAAIYSVADGGTLRFFRQGERARVTCDLNGVEAEVLFSELDVAIRDFHTTVADWLRTRVPEIMTHPNWPKWTQED